MKLPEFRMPLNTTHEFNGAVIGMVLGDSHLESTSKKGEAHDPRRHKSAMCFGHCLAQKSYMIWKAELLKNYLTFGPVKDYAYVMKKTGKTYFSAYVRSRRSFKLSYVYPKLYQFRKKILSRKLLNRLTPLGLAIWYMDDGYLESRRNKKGDFYPGVSLRLHTECFSYEQTLIARAYFLEVHGISTSVLKATNKKWVLWFSVTEAEKFLTIVRPYVEKVECFRYKLPEYRIKAPDREHDIVRTSQKCEETGGNDQPLPLIGLS